MFFAIALLSVTLEHPMLVQTDWLAEHLGNPLTVVVEVGNRRDFDEGHIPGARFVDARDLVADCDGLPDELTPDETLVAAWTRAGVGDSKRIVVYSRDPLLATRAWFTLDYLGHGPRASVLDGGIEQWRAERRTVTKADTIAVPQPFTVQPRPHSVTRFAEMSTLIHRRAKLNVKLVTIDARPSIYYRGDYPGAAVERAGHIPDAVSVPWTANLSSEHPPLFRPILELRGLYESTGATRDAIVVAYCRSGMEASMTYFVMRLLGYDVTLYDGSFVEWSRSRETVVVDSGVPVYRMR